MRTATPGLARWGQKLSVVRAPTAIAFCCPQERPPCAEAPLGILDFYFETVVNLFTGLSTPSLVPSGRAESTV